MPLSDIPLNQVGHAAARESSSTSQDGPAEDSKSSVTSIGQENAASAMHGIHSMLKTTTELGGIDLQAFQPSRYSQFGSSASTQRYRGGPQAPRSPLTPVKPPSGRRSHRSDPNLSTFDLRTTPRNYTTPKNGGSQIPPTPSFERYDQGPRAHSMTQRHHPPYMLPTYRSTASLRTPHNHLIHDRPRSPYAYPTRLRRPGSRPSSPSFSDPSGPTYRPPIVIDRRPSYRVPSPSSHYQPPSSHFRRVPSAGSYRSDSNNSAQFFDNVLPFIVYGEEDRNSPYPAGLSPQSSQRIPADYTTRSSEIGEVSLTDSAHVHPLSPRLGAAISECPAPLFYDYTEHFDSIPYFYDDEGALDLPFLPAGETIHEDGLTRNNFNDSPTNEDFHDALQSPATDIANVPHAANLVRTFDRETHEEPILAPLPLSPRNRGTGHTIAPPIRDLSSQQSAFTERANGWVMVEALSHIAPAAQEKVPNQTSSPVEASTKKAFSEKAISENASSKEAFLEKKCPLKEDVVVKGEELECHEVAAHQSAQRPRSQGWVIPSFNFSKLNLSDKMDGDFEMRPSVSDGVLDGCPEANIGSNLGRSLSSQSHWKIASSPLPRKKLQPRKVKALSAPNAVRSSHSRDGSRGESISGHKEVVKITPDKIPVLDHDLTTEAQSIMTHNDEFITSRPQTAPSSQKPVLRSPTHRLNPFSRKKMMKPANVRKSAPSGVLSRIDSVSGQSTAAEAASATRSLTSSRSSVPSAHEKFAIPRKPKASELHGQSLLSQSSTAGSATSPTASDGETHRSDTSELAGSNGGSSDLQSSTAAELEVPAEPNECTDANDSGAEEEKNSCSSRDFKLKASNSHELKRPASPPESRPWNLAESYPWDDNVPSIDVGVSPAAPNQRGSTARPPKFKVKVRKSIASNSEDRVVDPNAPRVGIDGQATESQVTNIITAGHNNESLLEQFSRRLGIRNSQDSSQDTSDDTSRTRPESCAHDPGDRYPTTGLAPPPSIINFEDVRSFFSDDSSQVEIKGSLRKRLTQFRPRLPSSRAASMDGSRAADKAMIGSPLERYNMGVNASAYTFDGTTGMSNMEYKTRKMMEKLKGWWAQSVEKLREIEDRLRGRSEGIHDSADDDMYHEFNRIGSH
ncbi:MAG: hypothetical protein M1819_002699 [Sarea resinae]|nr:MAG: hypothetical protein M1819_002699 [Sarea resinae]